MNNSYGARMERFLEPLFPKQKENIHWYGLTGVLKLENEKNVEFELIGTGSVLQRFSYTGFKVRVVHLTYGLITEKNFFFGDFFAEIENDTYRIIVEETEVKWQKEKPNEEQCNYLEEKMWKYVNEWA